MTELKMKIVVKGYPCDCEFEINEPLPEFVVGCKVRRKLLHAHLRTRKKEPFNKVHMVEDYLVEIVKPFPDGEQWFVGS